MHPHGSNLGLDVRYCDKEGREIDREMFPGIKDYRLELEHVDAQLKKFWEHRIDSN
jgi:hypothetical protein